MTDRDPCEGLQQAVARLVVGSPYDVAVPALAVTIGRLISRVRIADRENDIRMTVEIIRAAIEDFENAEQHETRRIF